MGIKFYLKQQINNEMSDINLYLEINGKKIFVNPSHPYCSMVIQIIGEFENNPTKHESELLIKWLNEHYVSNKPKTIIEKFKYLFK